MAYVASARLSNWGVKSLAAVGVAKRYRRWLCTLYGIRGAR